MNIIRPSISKFISAAFLVYKRNGKVRLVVNYKKVNRHTEHLAFPFPKIDTLFHNLKNKRWFSQIDMNLGYDQILLNESSTQYTAFALDGKVWVFVQMPFGLKNAPHSFQKTMVSIFGEYDFIRIYLDDLLIS